jgi:hypothetical protein
MLRSRHASPFPAIGRCGVAALRREGGGSAMELVKIYCENLNVTKI